MAVPRKSTMDEFETAFQNLTSALRDQEHFNNAVSEEVKTTAEINVQKFTEAAHQLEKYFLEKKLQIMQNRPVETLNEEISELKQELERKDAMIKNHNESLVKWINTLSSNSLSNRGNQLPNVQGGISQHGNPSPGKAQGPLASLEATTSNIGLGERR